MIEKIDIEKQLQSHEWLTKLIEDQLKLNKTYYTFGENFARNELKNKFKNVTIRKRRLLPLTSEDRLKDLPGNYTQIPTDRAKKIEAAKNVFSNIIKQIPPESYKRFKIDYHQSNDIDISEVKYESDDDVSYYIENNRIQNLFKHLQKDSKSNILFCCKLEQINIK